jgi:hypothetical protein
MKKRFTEEQIIGVCVDGRRGTPEASGTVPQARHLGGDYYN